MASEKGRKEEKKINNYSKVSKEYLCKRTPTFSFMNHFGKRLLDFFINVKTICKSSLENVIGDHFEFDTFRKNLSKVRYFSKKLTNENKFIFKTGYPNANVVKLGFSVDVQF